MAGSEETLAPLFEALAGRGDDTAVLQFDADGRSDLSYGDLAEATVEFAAGSREAGISAGDAVLLYGANRLPWIVACLGLLRAGAVPVPLDTQLTSVNLARIVRDSGARWALADVDLVQRLESACFEGRSWLLDSERDDERHWQGLCIDHSGSNAGLAGPEPDDPALLFYTSGTTGPPKGVPLTQRNVAFQIKAVREAKLVRPGDRALLPLPGHHVYPLVIGTLASIAIGMPVVLPYSITGPQLVRAIREGEVSIIVGVPRLYAALMAGIERRLDSGGKLRSSMARGLLRLAIFLRHRLRWRTGKAMLAPLHRQLGPRLRVLASGGSALDADLAWKLEGLGWQIAIGYGLTETSPLLTLNLPGGHHPESVGKPVPGIELRIDPTALSESGALQEDEADHGQREPGTTEPDVEGEVLARGAGVFGGYHRLPDKTAEAFSGEWFRTGDLGRFDSAGRLYLTGRLNTLIVTAAGENVQPDEVEQTYEQHEAIEEVGILADGDQLVAVIVPSREAARSEDATERIRRAVVESSKALSSHHRIDRFELSREPLDRTRLGKIQRHLLVERYRALREGEVQAGEGAQRPADIQDLTAEDRRLLRDERARAAWDLLVADHPDRWVHPEADLRMDVEIDSLGWLDLTMELARRTGIELSDERIAGIVTVRDLLAAMTESQVRDATEALAPLRNPGSVLSDRQRRWLKPLSSPANFAARVLHRLNRMLLRRLFELEVEGLSHLPGRMPLVLAPNHASYLDPFVIGAALPLGLLPDLFWGGWTGAVFHSTWRRGLSRLGRAVPVDPDRAVISSLALGAAVLAEGKGLVWFPEGERSLSGELGEFRQGLGMLLEAYPNIPVVPVFVDGTHEAWPPQRSWPRLRPVRVRFGEPRTGTQLDQCGEGEQSRERITRAVREAVAALASL